VPPLLEDVTWSSSDDESLETEPDFTVDLSAMTASCEDIAEEVSGLVNLERLGTTSSSLSGCFSKQGVSAGASMLIVDKVD